MQVGRDGEECAVWLGLLAVSFLLWNHFLQIAQFALCAFVNLSSLMREDLILIILRIHNGIGIGLEALINVNKAPPNIWLSIQVLRVDLHAMHIKHRPLIGLSLIIYGQTSQMIDQPGQRLLILDRNTNAVEGVFYYRVNDRNCMVLEHPVQIAFHGGQILIVFGLLELINIGRKDTLPCL